MTPSPDALAREILDVVPSVMRAIRAEMRSYHTATLEVPQFRALRYINHNPGTSLQEVAHHLGLTAPTVSKMVDGLVSNRLVQRELSPADRRKITLNLTSQGKEIFEQAHQAALNRLAEALVKLSPHESETVMQALQLLQPLFLPALHHTKGKTV